jgi:hypothetical protein
MSLNQFKKHPGSRQLAHQKKPSVSNMTPYQHKSANAFTVNDDHIVVQCDINLGGAILELDRHKNQKGWCRGIG